MGSNSFKQTSSLDEIVSTTIAKVGKNLVLGTPLGLGKANHIINAFYKTAKADPSINLRIMTALTLGKPKGKSLLEKRFIEPFAERVFGNYEELLYELERHHLPKNIEVVEFYFPAGKQLHNDSSQQNYISTNYTHVARDLIDAGVNVICQLVAKNETNQTLSLSCNPDVTMDVVDYLDRTQAYPYVSIAQVNNNLPYMYGDAVIPMNRFDYIYDDENIHFKLFGPPKMSVSAEDHMIGLYASTLVKDGGELQIGIGSLGDALVNSLLLRQKDNQQYKKIIDSIGVNKRYGQLIKDKGDTEVFNKGLFAASEMFVDGFKDLIQAGILKRKVYDHIGVQRLINEGLISESVNKDTLYELVERRYVKPQLSEDDFNTLQKFGILKETLNYENGSIVFEDQTKVDANLNDDRAHNEIVNRGLGSQLKNGAILHGGFFLGCQDFYQWLRDLPENERQLIHMKSVLKINQLYGHEELDRLHRKDARFINTCMMMTLLGAAVSDGLEDGRVVSGVGGQYNFVAMAQELPDGYSVLQLRSTRTSGGKVVSNIVFNYGHITIPRHLRDIVITEYGIADIRGKADREVIKELIQIADSRFQEQLVHEAKESGKLPQDFVLHDDYRNNFPTEIHKHISSYHEFFDKFPFGTDLTEEEIQLGGSLKKLKKMSKAQLLARLVRSLVTPINPKNQQLLERMDLWKTKSLKEKIFKKLLNSTL